MKKAILVLGPPRSGTSAISHAISKLGVDFGNPDRFVDPKTHTFNPIFFELQSLNDLNDEIFRYFGKLYFYADWMPLKSDFTAAVVDYFFEKIRNLIDKEFTDKNTIGLKDPRFCFTAPVWEASLKKLGFNVYYINAKRNLDSTFHSNVSLNGDKDLTFRLIAQSILCADYLLSESASDVIEISYEEVLSSPDSQLTQLCQLLGLDTSLLGAAKSAIQPSLRHHKKENRSGYHYLDDLRTRVSEHNGDHEYLRYREVSLSFAKITLDRETNKYANKINDLGAQASEYAAKLAALDAQVAEYATELQKRDAMLVEHAEAAARRDHHIQALLTSNCWRITAPIRCFVNTLRGRAAHRSGMINFAKMISQQFPRDISRQKIRRALINFSYSLYRNHLRETPIGAALARYILKKGIVTPFEVQIAAILSAGEHIAPKGNSEKLGEIHGLHWSPPLNLRASDELLTQPRINVLLPSLCMKHMSGGPNTALLVAALLAERGERIRLISTDAEFDGARDALLAHMDGLAGRPVARDRIEIADAFDRGHPTSIGARDIFLATAWWTAQIAKYAVTQTVYKTFIYLIQDFEPILHEGSTSQARALETYSLPHIPVINTTLLFDHLVKEGAGLYADSAFADKALCFEPALDRDHYFPVCHEGNPSEKKVLLFYARPTSARRNLFELGVAALREAVASGAIDADNWDVWGMGEKIPPIPLGKGVTLNPLPWMNFEDYAKRVRTADLLLSLMLSPHPSYPPLEMAASGNLVVTNSFSVKTAARMKELSPNIMVAEPTAESIAAELTRAALRINAGFPSYDPSGTMALPAQWDESFRDIIPRLLDRIQGLRGSSEADAPRAAGYPKTPKTPYERYRRERLEVRRGDGEYRQQPGLLSFVTSAYNTDAVFLRELGNSIFQQDGGTHFEWLILDNGSTREETVNELKELARVPCVRLLRVEENLGIIGGMRFLLERAQGRYVLPLDSDDLVEPDCVNVLTRHIVDNDFPPLLYTDEDKLNGESFGLPYFKPDWDPVLFIHSCYIAHLCAIDREKALDLGLYSDRGAEGCHDWDSFIRFMQAGYSPVHIPEVLYSWRIHQGSTSGNIDSKSYISNSHENTLRRFLAKNGAADIDLVNSPLFSGKVDWWFRRRRVNPQSMRTVVIGQGNPSGAGENFLTLDVGRGVKGLAEILEGIDSELVHFLRQDATPGDDEWRWDCMALLELFPDSVMVGGLLHKGGKIIDAPTVFGFGDGLGCPDVGRTLSDPGYGAGMWKAHSVSAVPMAHCVVKTSFLRQCVDRLLEENVPVDAVSLWLGGRAMETRNRVIYSPFMRAKADKIAALSPAETGDILSRFWALIPDQRAYSPRLGLDAGNSYAAVPADDNRVHMARLQAHLPPYQRWLERHLRRRRASFPLPDAPASITLVTTIYEKTDVLLLDALAESVVGQTVKADQWVIVAHGPIAADALDHIARNGAERWRATIVIEPNPLGIMGAMRRGLEWAEGDYIVPVDADDLLTPDAIQILVSTIARNAIPDMVYSDEDLLVRGQPAAPYLRPAFDPVLNLDSSYVWHLCAINRRRALALELYTDPGATWCHDWDTMMRVAAGGGSIVHVPEVLYHWRQHDGSTTNNSTGDSRSLDSVRHVLEGRISRSATPHLFRVEDWPESRGARELHIARLGYDLPRFVWIGDATEANSDHMDAILVIAGDGVFLDSQKSFVEAARLFDLHPKVGAVGGLVADRQGIVVDGCHVLGKDGMLHSPWLGKPRTDPGPYALALKPQTVATAGSALALFRISALRAAGLLPLLASTSYSETIARLCGTLAAQGWSTAFSPLIRGTAGSGFHVETAPGRAPAGLTDQAHALLRYGAERHFNF